MDYVIFDHFEEDSSSILTFLLHKNHEGVHISYVELESSWFSMIFMFHFNFYLSLESHVFDIVGFRESKDVN